MNVTNVTVTKVAEEKTANGLYVLEYSAVNGELNRVQATIQEREADQSGNHPIIGSIYLEQGNVSCNLPNDRNLAPYFTDFDILLKAIRETILKEE
jgi:hypothetical protein